MLNPTPQQHEITRHLQRLDAASRDYESRWGLGVLDRLATPELADKWQKQWAKVNAAIAENDDFAIPALVDGTIRGWKALEDAALAAGHRPAKKDLWEVMVDGQAFAIVKNNLDAHAVAVEYEVRGYKVLTVDELVRSYFHKIKEIYQIPDGQVQKLDDEFFKQGGDPLPF